MASSKNRKNGKLKGGALPPSQRKAHGRRVTQDMYEAMWKAYEGGMRVKRDIQRSFGVTIQTVNRCVDKGYPDRGWSSFKERLQLLDASKAHADAVARSKAALEIADEWQAARQHNLKLIGAGKGALAHLVQGFFQTAANVRWVKDRRYKDAQGQWHTTEVPMTAGECARIGFQLAQSVDILLKAEALQLGKPTENINLTEGAPGWFTLSEEQIQHMVDTGQFPAGVSPEQVFGAAALKMLPPIPDPQDPTPSNGHN